MNPPEALEGQEINLTLKHASVTFFVCNWYRETENKENLIVTVYLPPLDGNTLGPAYTKRETPGFGCSLLIANLHPNDSGNYIVTKSGPSVSGRGLINIQVLEAIKNITISHPAKIFETNTTHLNCTASGSDVSYYWLKGNQSLEVADHIFLSSNGQNLTLKPTKRQDSNRYTCFGNNSFSSNFTSYTLNVLYGPDAPVISPSVQFYAESSNLTLSCQADSNPAANYTWYFKSSTYPGKTFQIFNLSSVHNGSYKCEAYNNETKLSSSKIQPVCVLETLSDPVLWSSASLVSKEENVTLHCRTSNSSKVTVTWSKDGAPVPVKAEFSDQNRTLILPKFAQDYAGTYTCTARNPVSNATSNPTKIAMAYGPMAAKLNQSEAIVQPLGSALVLLCTADSMPPAEFRWFFNNTAKNEMEDTLRVDLLAWDDEGNYTCQARNSFTGHTASASVYVKLTGESSEPPGLSVGAIVGIVIGSVAGAVLCVGVVYFLFTKASCWRTEQHASNGNIPSAPGHNQATDTKSKPGEEDIQYSTLAFSTNNASQPTSGLSRPLDSGTIYSEIKKK
ncbi:carcinoembryonic antigen-related cell adhesion molecule 1-like isoform X1 [Python bivittatus]|uniref:Carcinoembryonic antigen-related cell adhesion molecule 1-like isoform X1 n=2 Tax=Python bivittatus TaxID=176946 RepID=A0A9F5IQN7_PYTBI|nr:carcinoembryonic antigen-related cell adhesion molecule 1-like isoform X1 [Python bivittatus]